MNRAISPNTICARVLILGTECTVEEAFLAARGSARCGTPNRKLLKEIIEHVPVRFSSLFMLARYRSS